MNEIPALSREGEQGVVLSLPHPCLMHLSRLAVGDVWMEDVGTVNRRVRFVSRWTMILLAQIKTHRRRSCRHRLHTEDNVPNSVMH